MEFIEHFISKYTVLHLSFAILCKFVLLEPGAKNKCDFVTCVAKKLNCISLLHPTIQ